MYYTRDIESAYNKKRILAEQLQQLLLDPNQSSLYLSYQPILSRDPDRLGCEALIRWQHSEFGYINPQYLIEIAEEYGLGKSSGHGSCSRSIWHYKMIGNLTTAD